MLITTVLTFFVVRHGWGYPLPVAIAATSVFLALDVLLVISCSLKFWQGGWFPLVLVLAIFTVMATWRRGRELLLDSLRTDDPELRPFITMLATDTMHRVSRTAVYAVANPDTVPQALMHNLILTVVFHDMPWIAFEDRVQVTPLVAGFWKVQVNYGFKNTPDIPKALELCRAQGLPINLFETSYFLSRETICQEVDEGFNPDAYAVRVWARFPSPPALAECHRHSPPVRFDSARARPPVVA
jgi:KUP system potassium uptake protein